MITNINGGGRYIMISKYQEQHGENVNIMLTPEADIILEWAAKKMKEEQRIQELAKNNPTIADAVDTVNRAKEQLDMILLLTDKEMS